jgi:tetratricopeptide (TPR) repeat protein
MTGVVTPAMIPSIGNLAHLEAYVKGMKTTFIATLRERMEIANSNPVFTSDMRTPEVMEVFAYAPGRTHIMVQRASALNQRAARLMASKLDGDALPLLQQSYQLDPNSARTCTLLGVALLNLHDTTRAVEALQKALRLHPDYAPAMVPLADVLTVSGEYITALSLLRRAIGLAPNSQIARTSLERTVRRQYEQGFMRMRLQN